ncbi:hypothetical protein V2J09_018470 [Rumex salicifolius]
MDSDLQHQQYHHHFQGLQSQLQLPKQQMNSGGGLTRYRSAPSSYFSNFMDPAASTGAGDLPQPRPLSPETESFLARFVQSVTDAGEGDFGAETGPVTGSLTGQPDFPVPVKQEIDQQFPNNTGFNSSSTTCHQTIHHSSCKPPLARRSGNSIGRSRYCGKESNLSVPSTNFSSYPIKMETGLAVGGSLSSLTRHRSSPAGLFDDIIIENGISTAITDAGNMGIPAGDANFMNSFPVGSWDDPTLFSDQFPPPDKDIGELIPSRNEEKEEEGRARPWGLLAHHLSLPKASLEKLLQLQDSVPCQMRAKRGRATHPRSIAERVRRTKISERMRKLQDLVPNMDKQTNTSEMLDFAVDYIKDLQRKVQTLTNKRARCTCSTLNN